MPKPPHNSAKIPRGFLRELGIEDESINSFRVKGARAGNRKGQRKATRVEKKQARQPARTYYAENGRLGSKQRSGDDEENVMSKAKDTPVTNDKVEVKKPKSILKRPKSEVSSIDASHASKLLLREEAGAKKKKVSGAVRDRLAQDDAEIAALEKALGIKNKRKLPQAFADEGLEDLLDGLGSDGEAAEKKESEEANWLRKKRLNAIETTLQEEENDSASEDDDGDADGGLSEDLEDFSSADSEMAEDSEADRQKLPAKRVRENPYTAPSTALISNEQKYIPPSLRGAPASENESMVRLRRQIQGLLNKLSDANMLSIVGDFEKLYMENPRQNVTTTAISLLVGLLNDPTALNDTFIILHAGFIAAAYKVIGSEFGAQLIQRVVEELDSVSSQNEAQHGKRFSNLISLLSELYTFHVVGSGLIYDYIRGFIKDFSENSTELLLRVIKNAGPQLRQDDPSALKEIVLQLQVAVGKIKPADLSVRTKFMIETIENLKNNRMKTGVTATSIASEHTNRMKKALGTLNMRTVKASEPLQISLKDIRNSQSRGKWWLIGASYRDQDQDEEDRPLNPSQQQKGPEQNQDTSDLLQLAKEHRMNTDIRRSIFVTIMSSTDYYDAHQRLLKLHLKKSQELDIPKVLIHCASAEESYNHFYTLIASQLCSERRISMAFQYSLWDIFKRMGENDEEDGGRDDYDENVPMELRSIVNLAKMFATLILGGGLGLSVLKFLNIAFLKPQASTFVELLFVHLFTEAHRQTQNNERREKILMEIFLTLADVPDLATGLRFFLRKVVRNTDIAGGKRAKETVKWGCRVASDALKFLSMSQVAEP